MFVSTVKRLRVLKSSELSALSSKFSFPDFTFMAALIDWGMKDLIELGGVVQFAASKRRCNLTLQWSEMFLLISVSIWHFGAYFSRWWSRKERKSFSSQVPKCWCFMDGFCFCWETSSSFCSSFISLFGFCRKLKTARQMLFWWYDMQCWVTIKLVIFLVCIYFSGLYKSGTNVLNHEYLLLPFLALMGCFQPCF